MSVAHGVRVKLLSARGLNEGNLLSALCNIGHMAQRTSLSQQYLESLLLLYVIHTVV